MDHSGLAARRLMVGAAAGVAAAAIAIIQGASWSVAVLLAYDTSALVFIVWVWMTISGSDPVTTARIALAEDDSRATADAILVTAGAASLVAVGFTLSQASRTGPPGRGLLTGLALGSVALAWVSVHTVYLLRYARLYYGEPEGGIDFK